MRAYGQKKVYGRHLTQVVRKKPGGKIHVETGVKSHKAGRRWVTVEYYGGVPKVLESRLDDNQD